MNKERRPESKRRCLQKSMNNIKNSGLGQNATVSGCLSLNIIQEQVPVLLQGLPQTSFTVGKGTVRFR